MTIDAVSGTLFHILDFGHHTAARIKKPQQGSIDRAGSTSGPINFFAHPAPEMAGESINLKPTTSFIKKWEAAGPAIGPGG